MANDIELTPLLMDLVEHAKEEGNAIEELRQALNSIIGRYKLHPSLVISMLARLTAGYINLTQAFYNKKNDAEVVEADYLNMLTANLINNAFDEFNKAQEEIKKLKQGSDFQERGS